MSNANKGPAADFSGVVTNIVLTKYNAPEAFRKSASNSSTNWLDIPDVSFADDARTYPINNAQNLWLSTAFCFHHNQQDTVIGQRVKQACYAAGVGRVWETIEKIENEYNKPKEYNGPWALPELKKYPINTPARVKLAAEYIIENNSKMSNELVTKYATNVIQQDKNTLDFSTRVELEKLAGLGKPKNIDKVFNSRKAAAAAEQNKEIYDTLDKLHKTANTKNPYMLCDLVKKLDKSIGWKQEDPTDYLVGATPTFIKNISNQIIKSASDNYYLAADFKKIPSNIFVSMFNTGPIVSNTKLATLLTDNCEIVEQLAEQYDIRPFYSKPKPKKLGLL